MKTYQEIAEQFNAMKNCEKMNNQEWYTEWHSRIEQTVKEHFPSGAGFDSGTTFDFVNSTSEKLVFNSAFHFMNENGCYDVWADFQIIVRPSLQFGFTLTLKSIGEFPHKYSFNKDYILECFDLALNQETK